jgi:hypothetical protein
VTRELKESISGTLAALAVIFCCTLPFLILSGIFASGSGLVLSQQILIAFGLILILLGGVSWLLFKRRSP